MKHILIASILSLLASSTMAQEIAEIEASDITDGQILLVAGYKNMMPGPVNMDSHSPAQLTVKFLALSNGCTKAEDFKIELTKVNEKVYVISATRVKPDICEVTSHILTLKAQVRAEGDLFQAVDQGEAQILTQPSVDVGVAH